MADISPLAFIAFRSHHLLLLLLLLLHLLHLAALADYQRYEAFELWLAFHALCTGVRALCHNEIVAGMLASLGGSQAAGAAVDMAMAMRGGLIGAFTLTQQDVHRVTGTKREVKLINHLLGLSPSEGDKGLKINMNHHDE